jgi:5-methyltetrahydrofolate--homocysteine methyltransferase
MNQNRSERPMHSDASYAQALVKGDEPSVRSMIQKDLDQGGRAEDILNTGLISAMAIIGEKFKTSEIYIPEMLISAITMKAGLEVLKPLLVEASQKTHIKVLLATVQDDLHDIGKNLVKIIFEGAGFDVIDLGTNVSAQDLVAAVAAHQPKIIGLSALLTTTMTHMQAMIQALLHAGLRNDVTIIVGGAPVTQGFADEIRADAYAPDAYSGVEIAKRSLAQ